MNYYKYTFYSLLYFSAVSCTSKLLIQSDPPQADVMVTVEGRSEKIKIGQTPMEISEVQLLEQLKITAESAQWIEFTFEKKDFQKRNFFVPSSRWGELSKIVKIKLDPMDDVSTSIVKMMRYIFNAKKFAETRQFEQAHQEIDKVLNLDSQIPQAHAMKAGIYFLQNNFADSSTSYRKAIELDPSFDEAIKMLEKIKVKTGGK